MRIIEDSKGRNWSSKQIFYSCLRAEKPFIPILIPLFIIAFVSKVFLSLPSKLIAIADLFLFFPFVGPVAGAMAMILIKVLPNVWLFSEETISIRGREFKNIKLNEINQWSISPIQDLPGYHVLQIFFGKKDKESCLVVTPKYDIENINKRLTRHSTGPANSAGL